MAAEKSKKCKHPPCTCEAEAGSDYCSVECEAMEDTPDIACHCLHANYQGRIHP
jgi:hypothetical protein